MMRSHNGIQGCKRKMRLCNTAQTAGYKMLFPKATRSERFAKYYKRLRFNFATRYTTTDTNYGTYPNALY